MNVFANGASLGRSKRLMPERPVGLRRKWVPRYETHIHRWLSEQSDEMFYVFWF